MATGPGSPGASLPPTSLRLVTRPPSGSDRWRLTDPYLELVWAPHLGPTATLIARHLGHALDAAVAEIDVVMLGALVGSAADPAGGVRRVMRALRRLSAAQIVSWSPSRSTVTLSGYVAPVPTALLDRLPAEIIDMHRALLAGPPAPGVADGPRQPSARPQRERAAAARLLQHEPRSPRTGGSCR